MPDAITRLFPALDRRRILKAGAALAGALAVSRSPLAGIAAGTAGNAAGSGQNDALPVNEIESILGAQGTIDHGVLSIDIARHDLSHVTGPNNLPFKPEWEANHELYFQSLGGSRAIFNGDFCLLARETQPVLDRILARGFTEMAFHQHFFDLNPQLWFMHFRGVGDPLELARNLRFVLGATGTPLPQPPPSPASPLDAGRIAGILGGNAEVSGAGVVSASVPRSEHITLGGASVRTELGILHTIGFQPLNDTRTAVAPDFALIGSEVDAVFRLMRSRNWQIHCLYNQETNEHPQFYFSHQLKVGDAYALAHEIRDAMNLTNAKFKS